MQIAQRNLAKYQTRGHQVLFDEIESGNLDLGVDGLNNITHTVLVHKKNLGQASSIVEFIKATDAITDGVRNIDAAKLPIGENFLVERIRLSFGIGSTAADMTSTVFRSTNTVDVVIAANPTSIDAEIANATIIIRALKGKVFYEGTVAAFLKDLQSSGREDGDSWLTLKEPKIWKGGQQLQVQFTFANAVTSANQHAQIELEGLLAKA